MSDRGNRHLRVVGDEEFFPAPSLTSVGRGSRTVAVPTNSTQSEERTRKEAWLGENYKLLGQIADLDEGWDTYGAGRIPLATLYFAAIALDRLWSERVPVPLISPMSNQAVMIEWRLYGSEITLEIKGPNDVHVLVERPDGSTEELHTTSDFSRITEALAQARPQLAVA